MIPALILLCACTGPPQAGSGGQAPEGPGRNLESGQALICYLYHSGWAVKTRNHLLIFDYTEPASPPTERSLAAGSIDPAEIADRNVTVFTSHSHSDHYDPRILDWRGIIKKIRYVWGWEDVGLPTDIRFGTKRRAVAADGLEILNIHHDFDGLPESAFLVRVDGVTIVHSGDHGRSRRTKNPVFTGNLEYLARKAPDLDIFFTPAFGGEMEALRILEPRVVFPMHDGGREHQYSRFAERVKGLGVEVEVGVAGKQGASFLYSGGRINSVPPAGEQ